MKAASLLLLCALTLAASPCFAQGPDGEPASQPSLTPGNSPQTTAIQNPPGYALGAALSFGAEPSNVTVSTEPSTLHVGIEPANLYIRIEPSGLHAGIEPASLHIGVEPSSLHLGIEASFPPYLGVMPPFRTASH